METILQQLMDLWVDFFATAKQKMIEDGASLAEIIHYEDGFLKNVGVLTTNALLQEVEQDLHDQIKATHRYHVIDKNRKRTLTTQFGDVEISRHYYRDKESGERSFLFDKMLKIPANDRIELSCKAHLVDKSADMSYQKAAEIAADGKISRQSICNAVKEAGPIPTEEAALPKTNPHASHIYIEADEDHVAMQDGTTKQNKLVIAYEDKKPIGKGRKALVAKRVFTGYRPALEIWKSVGEYIEKAYGPSTNVTIIGDGAAWIKKGLDVIPRSDFALDLFHLSKYAKKVTGNKDVSGIYRALRNDDRAWFKAKVEKELKRHPERVETIKEGQKYIENQWTGARRSLEDEKISSSTEAHVSHILSDRLSSRGMGWGETNSENIGSFRAYRENGGDLGEYLERKFHQTQEKSATNEVMEIIQEGLEKSQERALQRLRKARLGVRIGHMVGSEWGKNAWMRGIIDGSIN